MARGTIHNALMAILALATASSAPGAPADLPRARLPVAGPLPAARPETPSSPVSPPATEAEKVRAKDASEKSPPPPPVAPEDEKEHAICLTELRAIGATFRAIPRVDDGNGCGIDRPVAVGAVLPGVALSPEATLRCETALQLARMTREVLIPAAKAGLPENPRLTSINHASGYVCRRRNSAETGKISEHARGNGIDIASLNFGKVNVPMAVAAQEDSTLEAAFQRTLNAAACLYFTTVLSPGSDEAHQNHLHLDVIERRGGYRYCR